MDTSATSGACTSGWLVPCPVDFDCGRRTDFTGSCRTPVACASSCTCSSDGPRPSSSMRCFAAEELPPSAAEVPPLSSAAFADRLLRTVQRPSALRLSGSATLLRPGRYSHEYVNRSRSAPGTQPSASAVETIHDDQSPLHIHYLQVAAPQAKCMHYSQELLLSNCVVALCRQKLPALRCKRPALFLQDCTNAHS